MGDKNYTCKTAIPDYGAHDKGLVAILSAFRMGHTSATDGGVPTEIIPSKSNLATTWMPASEPRDPMSVLFTDATYNPQIFHVDIKALTGGPNQSYNPFESLANGKAFH